MTRSFPLLLLITCFYSVSQVNPSDSYIQGYYRSDGSYVSPHYRSSKNNTNSDNFTTIGNTNPYTGKKGTIYSDNKSPISNYSYETTSYPRYVDIPQKTFKKATNDKVVSYKKVLSQKDIMDKYMELTGRSKKEFSLWLASSSISTIKTIKTIKANVRSGPSISSSPIYQLEKGSTFIIVARDDVDEDWELISFFNSSGERLEGYLHKSLIVKKNQRVGMDFPEDTALEFLFQIMENNFYGGYQLYSSKEFSGYETSYKRFSSKKTGFGRIKITQLIGLELVPIGDHFLVTVRAEYDDVLLKNKSTSDFILVISSDIASDENKKYWYLNSFQNKIIKTQ